MGSRNGNSLPPPSPPPPLLFTSSLNFICATLAGMRTLKKKKKNHTHTLSNRQQLRRSHVASSHLKGEKSALSNTNMAKSPRHSRITPQPLPSLARLANIPAGTYGPFRGEARDPGESQGGTAGRAKEEITESTVEMFLLDHRTLRLASSERMPRSPREVQTENKIPIPKSCWAGFPHPPELTLGLNTRCCLNPFLSPSSGARRKGGNDAHVYL